MTKSGKIKSNDEEIKALAASGSEPGNVAAVRHVLSARRRHPVASHVVAFARRHRRFWSRRLPVCRFSRFRPPGLWQVLPLGPLGYGNSPYSSTSAFAGNPLLISLERLAEHGWIDRWRSSTASSCRSRIRQAAGRIRAGLRAERCRFCSRPHGTFCASAAGRCAASGSMLSAEKCLVARRLRSVRCSPRAAQTGKLESLAARSRPSRARRSRKGSRRNSPTTSRFAALCSSLSTSNGGRLRRYCSRARHPRCRRCCHLREPRQRRRLDPSGIFRLNENLEPEVVAGVPPDFFSKTGQRWGNPLYRWDVMKERGYRWWIQRLRWATQNCDYIRLDHFRGFDQFWEIPASRPHRRERPLGRWTARRSLSQTSRGPGGLAVLRRRSRLHHSGSSRLARAIADSGDGGFAIRLRRRRRAHVSAAPRRRQSHLHRHAR